MTYEWVKGKYSGVAAKHVLGLANAGVGYFILDTIGNEVIAAFRRAVDSPTPDHLIKLDSIEQDKLEKRFLQR